MFKTSFKNKKLKTIKEEKIQGVAASNNKYATDQYSYLIKFLFL